MSSKTYPDARLDADGSVVDFQQGFALPNYTGPVYSLLAGNPYVLWRHLDGTWDVINQGSTIVQTELDKFIKEMTT